jgi:hypothetical protein
LQIRALSPKSNGALAFEFSGRFVGFFAGAHVLCFRSELV